MNSNFQKRLKKLEAVRQPASIVIVIDEHGQAKADGRVLTSEAVELARKQKNACIIRIVREKKSYMTSEYHK